ncbi:MAG: hypoxanthine phosphoribosyltransferase [Bacteroidales bacterium]|nr:hypoxanthine phosphoribosyltransferase [Bacteroidales bacterium]MBN2818166.1 hypoxanthine phosphoribosyltransferase [Bacteroidales bacterium]
MKTIQILDKKFSISIPASEIQLKIEELAEQLNSELHEKAVVFVVILNGAFMFASDLYKLVTLDSRISFLKLASYSGTSSSGQVKQLIGLNESLKDKTVVILEDIIDTGVTLDSILKQLKGFEPAEIKIATLLHKPDAYTFKHKIDYIGFSIPNDFIVGYGLDYDGFGRNLDSIYTVID